MTQYLIRIIQKKALFLSLITAGGGVYAACNVNSSGNILIDQIPSITFTENGAPTTQFAAGLSCTGFSLAFLNMTYIRYQVEQMPLKYINNLTGESLSATYVDNLNDPVFQGRIVDISTLTIGNFFSGPDASIPFYVQIPPGQIVSPGIYTSETPFNVKWFYSVPEVAVVGLGSYFESPGFERGFFGAGFRWGSGLNSSINLRIEVLPDCRILTNDINFGTAAFFSAFEPVKTSMGIRCSAKTPYHVSLNNGLYPNPSNQNERRMKADSLNSYLNYQIYKNSSTERWGSNNQRWSSGTATTNADNYDGRIQQNYAFTAKILDNNSHNLPAGTYRDTITVQVEF